MQAAFPPEFLSRIALQLPTESEDFLAALAQEPLVSIRLNPAKLSVIPADVFPPSVAIPWAKHGYYLSERPNFTYNPLFHAGAFYVQEAASMLLAYFLEGEQYDTALDLCGAPGGKSTIILAHLAGKGVLLANEVMKSRAGILAENLSRWGEANVLVTNNDPRDFSRFEDCFDLILVDAPCSGEGMFRKDPESRAQWSPENVQNCAARQRRILSDVVGCLRPGGDLIYSTCTYAEAENEEIIAFLLAQNPDLEICVKPLPEHFGALPVSIAGTAAAAYRCYPHRLAGEGFFICRLRKKGQRRTNDFELEIPQKKKKDKPKNSSPTPKSTQPDWEKWINRDPDAQIVEHDAHFFYYPEAVSWALQTFQPLYTLKKGLLLGKVQGKDFNPSHELALSTLLRQDIPTYPLNYEEAISYLQKNDLSLRENEGGLSGWLAATYQQIPIGWLKAAGHRLKNHLPMNWRILR